jgi:HNH endonuclease
MPSGAYARAIRPLFKCGEITLVPLTRGLYAIIDSDDARLVEGFNWYAMRHRNKYYAARGVRAGGSYVNVFLHTAINPVSNGYEVDHVDGNTLNDRRCNLRTASSAQNQWNRPKLKKTKFGFAPKSPLKGAFFQKPSGNRKPCWKSRISVNGKAVYLGCFATDVEAAEAYAKASRKLHGEFAHV